MTDRADGTCGVSGNLFAGVTNAPEAAERFETLLERPGLKIERIVSTGQASPPGFWYDQPATEWVALLRGEAVLRFADEAQPRTLRPGDFVEIAPHRRHRVEATSAAVASVWLAIHY
jgi:cupin 2 domain-containing protein